MKVLILNSGLGHRMGDETKNHPKCMTKLCGDETILSRQLLFLSLCGIKEVLITTGYYDDVLIKYCSTLKNNLNITFVKNPFYNKTNYIYSIYCAREYVNNDDILIMHGDLVFDKDVLKDIIFNKKSCMKISTTVELPKKDFKAVVDKTKIKAVGIDFFDSSYEAQALYYLKEKDWNIWLNKIIEYCENGKTNCYAEEALNEVLDKFDLEGYDCKDRLCTEIDTIDDLKRVKEILK